MVIIRHLDVRQVGGEESRGLLGYGKRWSAGVLGGDNMARGGRRWGVGPALLGIAAILVFVDCSSEVLGVAICSAGLEGASAAVTAGICSAGWLAPVGTAGGNARADGEDALNDMGGSCGPVPFCCCCGIGDVAVCGCGRCVGSAARLAAMGWNRGSDRWYSPPMWMQI